MAPPPYVKTSSHCSGVNDESRRKFWELILLWSAFSTSDDSESEMVKTIFTLFSNSKGSQLMSFMSNILSTESIRMTTWCLDFPIKCFSSAEYDSIVWKLRIGQFRGRNCRHVNWFSWKSNYGEDLTCSHLSSGALRSTAICSAIVPKIAVISVLLAVKFAYLKVGNSCQFVHNLIKFSWP